MSISYSYSSFTNRRSGSYKKVKSDSALKYKRKRKNYLLFQQNKKRLVESFKKKLVNKLEKYRFFRVYSDRQKMKEFLKKKNGIEHLKFWDKKWRKKAGRDISRAGKTVWKHTGGAVIGWVSKAWNSIKNCIKTIGNGIKRGGERVFSGIKSGALSVGRGIKNSVLSIGRSIKRSVKSVSDSVIRVGRSIGNSVKRAVSGVLKTMSGSVMGMIKKITSLGGIFGYIRRLVRTASKKLRSWVSKGWTFIRNTMKKLFGWFKKYLLKIWNWFKKIITRIFDFLKNLFGGKNLLAKLLNFFVKVFALLFLHQPGQIFVRIKYLNGTLDKPWLLLPPLNFFPFSIVPLYMVLKGKVKKGVDDELPYDRFLSIILLLGMSLPTLEVLFDTTWFSPLYVAYVFGSWLFVYSRRDTKKCKKVRGRPDGFAMSKFLKSASNASLTFLLVRDLMEVLLVIAEKIPFGIGVIFKIMNRMPFVNGLISTSTAASSTYIINNMLNNTPFTKYCDNYSMKKGTYRAMVSLASLLLYFLTYNMNVQLKVFLRELM
jgi:hypothetical protein